MSDSLKMTDKRCWRCILLDEPCDDNGSCCELCDNDKDQYPNVKCKRGDIIDADDFNSKFLGVCESEDGVWHFKSRWQNMKIFIDYSEVPEDEQKTSIVLDLPLCAKLHSSPNLGSSIVVFLRQFESLAQRWSGLIESITEDMIGLCASYQAQRFLETPYAPTSLTEDSTLIIMALRCLVTSQNLANVMYCWLPNLPGLEDDDFQGCITETYKSEHGGGYSPRIELWRLPKDTEIPQSTKEPCQAVFMDTFQLAHKILLRRDPKDWPYVFCTLCILCLVHNGLEVTRGYTDALAHATEDFGQSILALCSVFLLCVNGHHPLHDEFDIERYAILVDDDEEALRIYRWMNDVWVRYSVVEYDEDSNSAETFFDKLDELVMDFIS